MGPLHESAPCGAPLLMAGQFPGVHP